MLKKTDETNHWIQLRDLMDASFNNDEVRNLCFDLKIDYDNLRGYIKRTRITELILKMHRSNRIDEFLGILCNERKTFDWPKLEELSDNDIEELSPKLPQWVRALIMFSIATATLLVIFTGISAVADLPNTLTFLRNLGASEELSSAFLPFAPEKEEMLIVVATFYHSEGVMDTEPHMQIKRELEKQIADREITGLRVELEPTQLRADNIELARDLGNLYKAGIIIWGEDTGAEIRVSFLNLTGSDLSLVFTEVIERERSQLANPSAYSQFVTQNLPKQMRLLALFTMGQSFFAKSDYDEAKKILETAIDSITCEEPDTQAAAEVFFHLGWIYSLTPGLEEKAKAAYDQVLCYDNNHAEAYNNRGILLYDQGDYESAYADYTQAIFLNENLAEAFNNRGIVFATQQKFDLALADFDKSINLQPQKALTYYNRGLASVSNESYSQAIIDYSHAIETRAQLYSCL